MSVACSPKANTFKPADYISRRSRIIRKLKELGTDSFLTLHPPNIRYLCTFKGETGALFLHRDVSFLLVDSRYITEAKDEVRGVEIRKIDNSLPSILFKLTKEMNVKRIAVEEEHITYGFFNKLRRRCKKVEILPVREWVENLRVIKDEREIANIRDACKITDKIFKDIKKNIKWGMKESDLANELEYRLKREGSEELPFSPIVASGRRASYPHARPTNSPLREGELVIIDCGARYNGYCSDLTRTIGQNIMDEEKKRFYNLVLRAQKAAIEAIRPGVVISTLVKIVHDIFRKEKLLRYFAHALGHGVGLEVHEKPSLSLKKSLRLKEGMVVTIEPGLYIPGSCGVRIEDMILVTSSGYELLTSCPKESYGT